MSLLSRAPDCAARDLEPAWLPGCVTAVLAALTSARGSWIVVFQPPSALALNRYQLHLSWHRWLKTASAYPQGPQGLAGQDPR